MKPSDDKKLETFLKENRPLHPRHSAREASKIWDVITENENRQRGPSSKFVFGGLSTAMALVAAFVAMTLRNAESVSTMKDSTIAEDSLELGFSDNEEIYEVTDLLSLSK